MELYDSNLSIEPYEVTGSVYYDNYSVEGVEVEMDDGNAHLRAAIITMADEDGEDVHGPINRADLHAVENSVEDVVEGEWTAALHSGFFEFDDYDESDLRR